MATTQVETMAAPSLRYPGTSVTSVPVTKENRKSYIGFSLKEKKHFSNLVF
jgi:hypothetical protein